MQTDSVIMDSLLDQDLFDKATKYNINYRKEISLDLKYDRVPAKKFAEDILQFLENHKLKEAYIECDTYVEYGELYFKLFVRSWVEKTEKELQEEILFREKHINDNKNKRLQQYIELKKEFGDS